MMQPKRILYIEANRDGTIGGSYYSLLYLIRGLDRSRFTPAVLFCQDNVLIPEYRKATQLVYVNNFGPSASIPITTLSDVIKWPYRFFVKVILKQFALHRIIRELKPDLVHLNNGYSALHEWMLACKQHGIKIVAHDRGTKYPCNLQTRIFVRLLDAIICVSESYRQNVLRQKLRVKCVERVYNGLDIHEVERQIDPPMDATLREEFGLPYGQPVVGIIGNIDRWKGQHIVLQAVAEVKRSYPGIKCLIVGEVVLRAGAYKKELDEYVVREELQENVIFTGFRKDIPNILNLFDVMIHASVEPEPFGRVVLEGMALAKPIVATDGGGIPEIVVHGETGILVPMGDGKAMADSILYYLSHSEKAREMGEKGKRRLCEVFSNEKTVAAVEKVYEDIFFNSRCNS